MLPWKKVLDFNPLKCQFLGFRAFRTGFFGQVSRLRFGKFNSIFKKLSTFQKSDRLTKNGGNRSGSAPEACLAFLLPSFAETSCDVSKVH